MFLNVKDSGSILCFQIYIKRQLSLERLPHELQEVEASASGHSNASQSTDELVSGLRLQEQGRSGSSLQKGRHELHER